MVLLQKLLGVFKFKDPLKCSSLHQVIPQHVPERHEKCVTTSVKLFKMVFNSDLAEDQTISLIITGVQDFGHCADQ